MVKFALSTLAILSTASAFAPSSPLHTPRTQPTRLFGETPLAPPTQWGSTIPDILSKQRELSSQKLEFAPTIRASEVGLDSKDTDGQLEYVLKNKEEIKRRMVESGAGMSFCE